MSNGTPHRPAPERPPKPKFTPKGTNGLYPQISPVSVGKHSENDPEYEELSPSARIRPTRPAPRPPPNKSPIVNSVPTNYGTLSGSSDLDGVPFVLNPLLSMSTSSLFSVSCLNI